MKSFKHNIWLIGAVCLLFVAGCGGGGTNSTMAPVLLASTGVAAPDHTQIVQQLYISYFGRPADPDGLNSFKRQLTALGGPTDIQKLDQAYHNNNGIRGLVDSFGVSAESAALYSGDNLSFVTRIYTNVLNRAPDSEGLAFWTQALNSSSLTRANASLAIMAGAVANNSVQGRLDASLITKKVAVGSNFTDALVRAPVDGYKGEAAAARARAMLSSLTASTDIPAFQATIAALVRALADAVNPPAQPESIVSATGSAAYSVSNGGGGASLLSGSFTPSLDGFETEVRSSFRTIYRWIDKVSNARIEVSRDFDVSAKWQATFFPPGSEPYALGTGSDFQSSQGIGLCMTGECKIVVTGGTASTASVSFQAVKPLGTNFASVISGALTGSANDFIWGPFDLPKSTTGSLNYNGRSIDILSAHATSSTSRGYHSYTYGMRAMDGAYISAMTSDDPNVRVKQLIDIRDADASWNCGLNIEGACNFQASKRDDGTTRVGFSNVQVAVTSAKKTLLSGSVIFGQASSSLKINGLPFSIDTTDYSTNWLATHVSAVGSAVQYEFLATDNLAQVANQIEIWVRNGVVSQILIPSVNGTQFLCVAKPTASQNNPWVAGAAIAYVIPKCPAVSVSKFPDEGFLMFNFDNVSLTVEPSRFATPVTVLTLSGSLRAKGR